MTPGQKVIHEVEEKMKRTLEAAKREFSTIRTGRASSSLVEGILVSSYGSELPLKQLATITAPEPRLLVIQPWDSSILNEVERAILKADLGITPNNDGRVIRISIPHLTDERRGELVKIVKRMAEDGKVSIRTTRREANESIKILEKEKKITEDERYQLQDEIQKLTDSYIKNIDQALETKEKEIREV